MSTEELRALADRYTLDRLIGRGGMADVYGATDHLLEREVAVKVLRAHTASQRDRARFEREVRTLAQFDHPNLVSVLDAGINDDVPYLVMDLVEGRSLSAICADGRLPERQVALVGTALADALAYVHAHAVVHRDLKPSNVLVGSDGVVRLADFGIARLLGDTAGQTATGTLVGTAAYLAPEQVRGDPITPASDVYSLGLLLLEAISGVRAYTGTPMEAALARLHTAPPMPTSLSPGWTRLLRAMTDFDADRRPSAKEVGRVLRRLTEPGASDRYVDVGHASRAGAGRGYPERGPTDEAPRPASLAGLSRRAWTLAAVVVLVAALVGAGFLTLGGREATASASAGSPVPAATPDHLRQPLRDLHVAAGSSVPVSGPLGRVDEAVLSRHWGLARERLDELVRATVRARKVGTLSSARADAVQAASARLAADLPAEPAAGEGHDGGGGDGGDGD